jgi:hypothetical protein
MGKFVRWDVLDGRLSWSFDQDKIAAEKLFDGCHIVSGEVPKEKMAASEVVASYIKLGLAEEAFRNLKTVQLDVRPVYHKTDDRIRSHLFLCTLAYYLQWHLKQRLEPLFAADGTHKDRQWTVRNVIERLAAIRRDKIVMGDSALQTRKADVEKGPENRPKTARHLMPRTQDDFTTSRWRFRARKTLSRLRLRTRTPRRPSEKKYAAATKNSLPALNRKKVPLPPFFNQSRLCLTNCLICDCVRERASSATPKPPNNSSKVLSLTIS